MKTEWNNLMNEDEFRFTTASGPFDTALIARHVGGLAYSFRDSAAPDTFLVCASDEALDFVRKKRTADPDGGFPGVLIVQISPDEIIVSPGKTADLVDATGNLLKWLVDVAPVRVECDEVDVTDYIRAL